MCRWQKESCSRWGGGGTASGSGITKLQQQLDALESQEKNSRAVIVRLKNQLDSLEANPGQVPTDTIDELRQKIASLEVTQSTDHSAEIAALRKKLDNIKPGTDNSAEIAELTAEIASLKQERENNQKALDDLASSVGVSESPPAETQPTGSTTELPTISAYLTYAGKDFFKDGLMGVVTFSSMAGVSGIEQKTDLNSGSINEMPTTTIEFMFNEKKYCASVSLTKDNFVSYRNFISNNDRNRNTKKSDLETKPCGS